jgi:hypothetical protein
MGTGGSLEALLLALALNLGGAPAEDVTIHGVDVERTLACDGRDVIVYGTGHRLTLRGRCPYLRVQGTGHVVHVETLGRADLMGVENRLEWERALEGTEPRIAIAGAGNRAVHEAGAAREPAASTARSIVIDERQLDQVFDCAGGSASVESGDNRLTLRDCRELTVTGAENEIVLEGPVRAIRLLGNDNAVRWSEGEDGRAPRVETRGSGNRVSRR